MNKEEKRKCSELWHMVSSDFIAPNDWTESAADMLAQFFAEMKNCGNAMTFVPKPSGSKPGWFWVVNYVYDILNHSQIFQGCLPTSLTRYRSFILAECL